MKPERQIAVVADYTPSRGFGFLRDGDGKELFVHVSDVAGRCDLRTGQSVEFDRIAGIPGKRDRAINVVPID